MQSISGFVMCSKHVAHLVLANDTSAHGVIVVSAVANSRVVNTVMACCTNVRSRRQLGIAAGAAW
jgi:hypothetical protein